MTQPPSPFQEESTKPILNAPAWIDLSKYDQTWFNRGKPNWFIFLWWIIEGIAFPLTPHTFSGFRCWLLTLFGAKIGKGVVIRSSVRILYPWKVEIGDYSWLGDDVYLYSLDNIIIGSHCVISQKSYLCTGSHNLNDQNFGLVIKPINIGNGVWVAADCFIAPGVNIGANSIIGARSSVFKDIPHEKLAWGNPCLVRGDRH